MSLPTMFMRIFNWLQLNDMGENGPTEAGRGIFQNLANTPFGVFDLFIFFVKFRMRNIRIYKEDFAGPKEKSGESRWYCTNALLKYP